MRQNQSFLEAVGQGASVNEAVTLRSTKQFRTTELKKEDLVIKKVLATAAVAVSVAGMSATTAMAAGNDGGSANLIGNTSTQSIGATNTGGYMSPNMGLINGGVLNCFDVQKLEAQVPIGAIIAVPIAAQDLLGNPVQGQTCTQNSVEQKGDDALSHILDSILSRNGNIGG